MRVLVTGANGQLGSELKRIFSTGRAEIAPLPKAYASALVDYADRGALDISSDLSVKNWFSTHDPYNVIFNAAAQTNVDGCEKDEAGAYLVNALGIRNLALAAKRSGAKLVHVSTDYVFSGMDSVPRVETDGVCPVSAYGRSKLAGELLAQHDNPKTFVVRTAWLYGLQGKNFVKTMLRLAKEKGEISVVADQLGNPTNANDLAYELLRIALTEEYGVWHCTNEGITSWFEFAARAVDLAGIPCKKTAITSAEYKRRFPQSADRPAYSALDNQRLKRTIGNEMRHWDAALQTYIRALIQ